MIFCGKCGQRNNWPMSSVRANRVPCDVCGGFDQLQVKSRSGTRTINLPNYSYPSNLLPSVVERDEGVDVEQQ